MNESSASKTTDSEEAKTAAPRARVKPEVSPSPPTPREVKQRLDAAAKAAADPAVQAIRAEVIRQGEMNTAAAANPPRRHTEQFRRREYDAQGRETAS